MGLAESVESERLVVSDCGDWTSASIAALGGCDAVSKEEPPGVAVVADATRDARDADDEGGGEGIGEQDGRVVAAGSDFCGDELGAHDSGGAGDVELIEVGEAGEDFVHAGADEAADECAGKAVAKEFESGSRHDAVAQPGGADDEQA